MTNSIIDPPAQASQGRANALPSLRQNDNADVYSAERVLSEFNCGFGFDGIKKYDWPKDSRNLHFLSFDPLAVEPRDNSVMSIEQDGIKRLEVNNWAFLKRLESRTGCHITIPDKPFPRRRPVEIGFFGTKAGIEKAKEAVREKAMTYGDVQKWRSEIMKEPVKKEEMHITIEEIRAEIQEFERLLASYPEPSLI